MGTELLPPIISTVFVDETKKVLVSEGDLEKLATQRLHALFDTIKSDRLKQKNCITFVCV